MQSDGFNYSTLNPAVYGNIALSINTQYNTIHPGLSLFDLEHIRGCCVNFVLYKCFYSIPFNEKKLNTKAHRE